MGKMVDTNACLVSDRGVGSTAMSAGSRGSQIGALTDSLLFSCWMLVNCVFLYVDKSILLPDYI